MMKMAWGLLANAEDFWVKIIHGKYLPHGGFPNSRGAGQTSRLWQDICKIWNTIEKKDWLGIG